MAIYHCSVRTISRADNHSAVAAAAYRSGQILKDERTGQSHNYRNRKGILNALIFLPSTAPEAYADRLTLWNAAESAEVRKNSRVAREIILALPHELSEAMRLGLAKDMALFLVEKYGVAVDLAVHAPQEAHGDDPRNHHAHLLFTTREVTGDGLGAKTRILDDKEQGPVQIELIRQVWETLANVALQQAGFEGLRIDRRTLEDQGIDRIPQEHVGKAGTHADEAEEKRKKDDEEEDGETDTGKGKAGSDDKALQPSAAKKDSSSSKQKAPAKDRPQTRATLNEEIKRVNELRAAFSPIPLKDQIKELDRLMTRLDARVQRLKTLSDKTTLPERLSKAIVSLFNRTKELFAVRTKDEAARSLSAAEREAKAERQRARYGRTYRAHISERMAEMRENIQILETKQKQFQKYTAFVELIERRVDVIRPTLKNPALPIKTEWRITTVEAVQSKIIVESKQARERIPIEYMPTIKQEALTKSFTNVLKATTSPLAVFIATAPRTEKVIVQRTPTEFKNTPIKEAIIPKQPVERDKPLIWRVEVNERGKEILLRWRDDIIERKAAAQVLNPAGYSGKFNHPTKIVMEAEVIQKVRSEAFYARTKVPPDLRAAPYPLEKAEPVSRFSGQWQKASHTQPPEPVTKMSSKFNSVAQVSPTSTPNTTADPDLKI